MVDVRGWSGNLLGTILAAIPAVRSVLFERPQVVRDTERNMKAADVADRCEFVGGDFLEAVQEGGNVSIVSHCIHNRDEENCVRIVANCRRAMPPRARLLIVEAVARAGDEPDPAILDLAMLVVPGGEERSEDEYGVLLEKSGFRLTRVIPTRPSGCVIEAIPV